MAKRLILLFVCFIHVTVQSANARGEGEYTDDVSAILREMVADQSVWSGDEHAELRRVSLRWKLFKYICNDCSLPKKLSICIKAVQHKWKTRNPKSFAVNPALSDFKCRTTKFLGGNDGIFYQRMYVCPPTTVKTSETQYTEPAFLVGQGLHGTQYRIYIYKCGNPVTVEGQLTGFSLDELDFATEKENYVYAPNNESGNAVTNFRSTGNLSDYRVKWKHASDDEVSSIQSGTAYWWR